MLMPVLRVRFLDLRHQGGDGRGSGKSWRGQPRERRAQSPLQQVELFHVSNSCVSYFGASALTVVKFIRASDKCQREKRKTINGDDLLWAMATLGFEDYIDPLKIYLSRYREGDTKGPAKGGDCSSKKDGSGVHPGGNAQLVHQGSFSQGISYPNSQGQHLMVPSHE
ncbi:hypothetical protein SAY87_018985 [Trapa incisa]|uniref:Transcription factor CBF/NF-Y/archaeal histone domain-containing protein n=1 Tax=Trapa incisa TaxID=236973 RepID=A0AAN7Q229_9MYRT|nr:hypothetical protein SAY87_018985 [Trapa incisa]